MTSLPSHTHDDVTTPTTAKNDENTYFFFEIAPLGIAAEYAHPIESLFLGIGTLVGPVLFTRHLFSLWVWLFVRLYQTVEAHSGYDFPWSPTKLIPFWGGMSNIFLFLFLFLFPLFLFFSIFLIERYLLGFNRSNFPRFPP